MNYVESIRDARLVEDIANYLKEKNERDYVLFMLGINTGLRISDILPFKVKDVRNRDIVHIKETKTGKQKEVDINPRLKRILQEYTKDKIDEEYLFKSRQSTNKPIHRNRVYAILKDAAEKFNLQVCIGTHTMRKTFGYHFYKNNNGDIASLVKLFNHSHYTVTLRYIGVEQEEIRKKMRDFKIF